MGGRSIIALRVGIKNRARKCVTPIYPQPNGSGFLSMSVCIFAISSVSVRVRQNERENNRPEELQLFSRLGAKTGYWNKMCHP